MWKARLEAWYLKFWSWMQGSGTLLWTRFLFVANTILAVLVVTDVSAVPWFNKHPEWLVYWNIFAAVCGEFIRKANTEIDTRSVYVPDYGHVETKTLITKLPDGPPS